MHATTIINVLVVSLAGLAAAAPGRAGPPPTARKSKTNCVDLEHDPRILDTYTVYGSDYHDDMVGKWGEHLKNQLKGCGVKSNWHFEYNQQDGFGKTWDWKSWWNLPIGQKICVQKAINAVGGDNVDCIVVRAWDNHH